MQETGVRVSAFVNRREVALDNDEITAATLLREAGFEGDEWDLLRLAGKDDPTGGRPIDQNSMLQVSEGDHFRAIPGKRTFG